MIHDDEIADLTFGAYRALMGAPEPADDGGAMWIALREEREVDGKTTPLQVSMLLFATRLLRGVPTLVPSDMGNFLAKNGYAVPTGEPTLTTIEDAKAAAVKAAQAEAAAKLDREFDRGVWLRIARSTALHYRRLERGHLVFVQGAEAVRRLITRREARRASKREVEGRFDHAL